MEIASSQLLVLRIFAIMHKAADQASQSSNE